MTGCEFGDANGDYSRVFATPTGVFVYQLGNGWELVFRNIDGYWALEYFGFLVFINLTVEQYSWLVPHSGWVFVDSFDLSEIFVSYGPCASNTPTPTVTSSETPTVTPTPTLTQSQFPTATPTPSETPTITPSISNTATPSLTPSQTNFVIFNYDEVENYVTRTPTPSITPTNTPTPSITPSFTVTASITPTLTPSGTPTPTITSSPNVIAPGQGVLFVTYE